MGKIWLQPGLFGRRHRAGEGRTGTGTRRGCCRHRFAFCLPACQQTTGWMQRVPPQPPASPPQKWETGRPPGAAAVPCSPTLLEGLRLCTSLSVQGVFGNSFTLLTVSLD